jgi:hypothetical protein
LKRLALFWLVCALAGFAAVAGVAVLLSLTLDGVGAMRRAEVQPAARALGAPPSPRNSLKSPVPVDVGHDRPTLW